MLLSDQQIKKLRYHIRQNPVFSQTAEGYSRRLEGVVEKKIGDQKGFSSIVINIQRGMGNEPKLVGQIVQTIWEVQALHHNKYTVHLLSFGWEDRRLRFSGQQIRGSKRATCKLWVDQLCELAGTLPITGPAIIPGLFPIRNYLSNLNKILFVFIAADRCLMVSNETANQLKQISIRNVIWIFGNDGKPEWSAGQYKTENRGIGGKTNSGDNEIVDAAASPYREGRRMISHSDGDTRNATQEALANGIETLYQEACLNWRGQTTSKTDYSEIIADELLNSGVIDALSRIDKIERSSYKVAGHDASGEKTNRYEEYLAKTMIGTTIQDLGKIIDYQVPLKSKRNDKAGKIDLISRDDESGIVYLIELKAPDSEETILRCGMEIETYYRRLDHAQFRKDYDIPDDTKIRKAVLIYANSVPGKQLTNMPDDARLRDLLKQLEINFVVINISTYDI